MSSPAEALPELLDAASPAARRAARTRWWFIATVVVIAPLLLVLTGALALALWLLGMHGAALRKVNAEVARIQAAGEPITTDDLYAQNRVPAGTTDITHLWLAALGSVNEQQFNIDAKPLPIVGEGPADSLPATDLPAAESLLATYDATVQATLTASRADGECRFPVEFSDGFSALLPSVQKMRLLARLMTLRGRVAQAHGDTEQAVESVEAMFEGSAALSHQLLLVEHLVRMAIAGMALREVEHLLNSADLTDEQLVRLAAQVRALDFQSGQIRALQGERGLGYFVFCHPEQFDMAKGDMLNKANPGKGSVTRAADCLMYLELQRDMIAAAREPFPTTLTKAEQVEKRLQVLAGTRNPLERYNHMFTLLIMPAVGNTLQATARNIAERDLVLAALAARQYQHQHGELPASLEALVPQYLPAVPTDPYSGNALRLVPTPEGLTFYSVGRDEKDDGGSDPEHNGEPDVVVKLLTNPESTKH